MKRVGLDKAMITPGDLTTRVRPSQAGDPTASRLKSNVIGPVGLTALAIGITSPAMGLFSAWGEMQSTAGPITPLVFLAAMLITLPTAISYAVLNSRFPSAGAASTWVWRSISPGTGFQAGLLMTTYFLMGSVSTPLMFAMFFADLVRVLHAPLSNTAALYLGVLLSMIPVAIACTQGADVSIRATVRLMIAEVIVVCALSTTILLTPSVRAQTLGWAPFDPAHATSGFSGFWAAVVLGVLGFSGFDVVSTAAEETQSPRKHVPRAILVTIVGIALFWAANAWVLTLSTPDSLVRAYSKAGVPAVVAVAQNYWGWGSLIVIATALTGITAMSISIVLGTSRIIFALARHGLLPVSLGRVSGRLQVPLNAVRAVLGCTLTLSLVTLVIIGNGLDSFIWWGYAVVFFATLTFIAVNVASAVYFFRFSREEFGVLKNLLIPLIGVSVNTYVLYAGFFSALWSGGFRMGRGVVISCVAIFLLEIAIVIYTRIRAPALFDRGPPVGVEE